MGKNNFSRGIMPRSSYQVVRYGRFVNFGFLSEIIAA
jgi:hypothetical protein